MKNKDTTTNIGELTQILHSRTFYELIKKRKVYLQKEINNYVRKQDWFNAYATLGKFDDVDQLVKIATKELEDLQK